LSNRLKTFTMIKRLVYPFTFEQWLSHPSTKPKLTWIKKECVEMRNNKKCGVQLKFEFYETY